MAHFAQLYIKGEFRKLDCRIWKNLQSYGSLIPPKYNLKKITAPVAIYFGVNDIFVDPVDSMTFHRKIRNPIGLLEALADPGNGGGGGHFEIGIGLI